MLPNLLPRRFRRARLPAILAGAALLAGACSSGATGGATTGGAGATPASSVIHIGSPLVGKAAPPLVGTTLDGAKFDLASLKGSPVLVNFWASWCGPCRDEFPELKAALSEHAADGLVVLGVLFKDDATPAKDFMAKQGAAWISLADPDGAGAAAYRVVAPPTTFFIGRDGIVRDVAVGGMTADQLTRHLGTILP